MGGPKRKVRNKEVVVAARLTREEADRLEHVAAVRGVRTGTLIAEWLREHLAPSSSTERARLAERLVGMAAALRAEVAAGQREADK